MSAKIHQKKRNVGLIYEFLVRAASMALVEGNEEKSAAALRILRKHFTANSPLFREFKLFNSLMKVEVTSEAVASTILREARDAARSYDVQEVQRAKTRLINEVNKLLNDDMVWDVPIPNYRMYATIGTLISEWRQPTGRVDLQRLAQYETVLVNWLMENKMVAEQAAIAPQSGTEKLALRLALKKFNEKYASALLPEQKEIVRQWALSRHTNKPEVIARALREVKENTINALDTALRQVDLGTIRNELTEAKNRVLAESVDNVNEDTVKRFMMYVKLRHEITVKEEEEEKS